MRHDNSERDLAIKGALKDLVRACGGQVRAAAITGSHQSVISDACSINHMDKSLRLDHVAILEADAGKPIVTRALADLAGCDVQERTVAIGKASMMEDAAQMSRAFGEMQAKFMTAIEDGRLDPVEQALVRGCIRELRERLNAFEAQTANVTTVRAVKS